LLQDAVLLVLQTSAVAALQFVAAVALHFHMAATATDCHEPVDCDWQVKSKMRPRASTLLQFIVQVISLVIPIRFKDDLHRTAFDSLH
jgi:hypothetical protein